MRVATEASAGLPVGNGNEIAVLSVGTDHAMELCRCRRSANPIQRQCPPARDTLGFLRNPISDWCLRDKGAGCLISAAVTAEE
jgi:hypothetical protein